MLYTTLFVMFMIEIISSHLTINIETTEIQVLTNYSNIHSSNKIAVLFIIFCEGNYVPKDENSNTTSLSLTTSNSRKIIIKEMYEAFKIQFSNSSYKCAHKIDFDHDNTYIILDQIKNSLYNNDYIPFKDTFLYAMLEFSVATNTFYSNFVPNAVQDKQEHITFFYISVFFDMLALLYISEPLEKRPYFVTDLLLLYIFCKSICVKIYHNIDEIISTIGIYDVNTILNHKSFLSGTKHPKSLLVISIIDGIFTILPQIINEQRVIMSVDPNVFLNKHLVVCNEIMSNHNYPFTSIYHINVNLNYDIKFRRLIHLFSIHQIRLQYFLF
ncbi:hypothetical protein COBT_002423 [Conglomerata obtusa]